MLTNQSNCQTYTISAGQSAYQFPVPFHDPSELSVSVRDNSSGTTTPLARGSASSAGYYTIPAQDSYLSGGVAVTLNAATLSAYAGKTLVVTRDVPLNQLLDLPRAGRINTESLEKTMDRFVMMAQQLQEQLRRTLQCPQGAPYNREAAYRFFERMVNGIDDWLQQCAEAVSAGQEAQSAATAASSYNATASGFMNSANSAASVAFTYADLAGTHTRLGSKYMSSAGGYMSQASGYADNASSAASAAASATMAGKQDALPTGSNGQVLTMVNGGIQWANPPGGGGDVDSSLNSSSTNPVENRAVWSALSSKAGLSNGKVVSSQLPVAGSGSGAKGVVYAGDRGIGVLSNGGLYIQSATSEQISSRSNTYNPVLPAQINLSVKAALTDSNHITLSSAEQETARGVIGAVPAVHSHTIANVTGLQDSLNSCVAHVDSFAEVSAQWIANAAIRGTEKVYICRGENTTDLDEMLKGHIYHLQLFPETYEYTYEETTWEAEWVPNLGWVGHWEEVTETALRVNSNDLPQNVPTDYFLRDGEYVSEDGNWGLIHEHINNSAALSWIVYSTSISNLQERLTSWGPSASYDDLFDLQYTPSEQEVVVGIDWVSSGGIIWHAHTVTKTGTGFTIDYLWQDITSLLPHTHSQEEIVGLAPSSSAVYGQVFTKTENGAEWKSVQAVRFIEDDDRLPAPWEGGLAVYRGDLYYVQYVWDYDRSYVKLANLPESRCNVRYYFTNDNVTAYDGYRTMELPYLVEAAGSLQIRPIGIKYGSLVGIVYAVGDYGRMEFSPKYLYLAQTPSSFNGFWGQLTEPQGVNQADIIPSASNFAAESFSYYNWYEIGGDIRGIAETAGGLCYYEISSLSDTPINTGNDDVTGVESIYSYHWIKYLPATSPNASSSGSSGTGVEVIADTRSAAGAAWTGVTSDTELYDGKTILFRMDYDSAANATLNLTLGGSNGTTTTGAKNIYFNGATRLGTSYGAGNPVLLSYNASADSDAGAWYVVNRFTDQNNFDRVNIKAGIYAGSSNIPAQSICVYNSAAGGFVAAAAGMSFTWHKGIFFALNATSANAMIATAYSCHSNPYLFANLNGANIAGIDNGNPVYLVGTYSSGLITISSELLTCVEPSSANGKVYTLIGYCRTPALGVVFCPQHELLAYYDGAFQPWNPGVTLPTPSGPSYVVSGASGYDADANGTYSLVDGINGRSNSPVWSNGTYYLAYGYDGDNEENGWALTTTTPTSSLYFNQAPNYWVVSNDASAPPTSGWPGGVSVTQGS